MTILAAMIIMNIALPEVCHAQTRKKKTAKTEQSAAKPAPAQQQPESEILEYIIEGNDTIYIDQIQASKVYSRLPKMKGREWRKYYRLVHNFSKSYPYALVAKEIAIEVDSTIAADNLKGAKKEKYINAMQNKLLSGFESHMRRLTVSQGVLIMKLVDREIGKSSYTIIKDYKNRMAAGFWQGIAKIFGADLKTPYDPEGEDTAVEELVRIWEAGDFPAFYWSIFWKDPPIIEMPEEFR